MAKGTRSGHRRRASNRLGCRCWSGARKMMRFATLLLSLIVALTSSYAIQEGGQLGGGGGGGGGGDDDEYTGQDMIEWIRSAGGIVHPHQRIRRAVPHDVTSYYGVFATDAISTGEVLLSVPWDLIIKPDNYERYTDFSCDAVYALATELRLGSSSKYATYVTYLRDQPRGQLPIDWSKDGKRLLMRVAGEELLTMRQIIEQTSWIYQPCDKRHKAHQADKEVDYEEEDDGPWLETAFLLMTQRAEDTLMIPYFDMYNHRNGRHLNTQLIITEGEHVVVQSRRRIEPGEQIYLSYNWCNMCNLENDGIEDIVGDLCHDGWHAFGTPEVLQFFGFVEDLPRSYYLRHEYDDEGGWMGPQLSLCVDANEEGNVDAMWPFDSDTHDNISFLMDEVERLNEVGNEKEHRDAHYSNVTDHEWDTIWKLHEALSSDFAKAIDFYQDDRYGDSEDDDDDGDHDDDEEEDLEEEEGNLEEEEDNFEEEL